MLSRPCGYGPRKQDAEIAHACTWRGRPPRSVGANLPRHCRGNFPRYSAALHAVRVCVHGSRRRRPAIVAAVLWPGFDDKSKRYWSAVAALGQDHTDEAARAVLDTLVKESARERCASERCPAFGARRPARATSHPPLDNENARAVNALVKGARGSGRLHGRNVGSGMSDGQHGRERERWQLISDPLGHHNGRA